MTLTEALATIRNHCKRKRCEDCPLHRERYTQGFAGDGDIHYLSCKLGTEIPEDWDFEIVETNTYDEVEEYKNCTVQILRNSVTGEESVGWWENEVEK